MSRDTATQRMFNENNQGSPPVVLFQHLELPEKVDLLNKNGFLSGIRVDGNGGPRVSARVAAVHRVLGQHHSPNWIQEKDNIITETVHTPTRRESSYVHQGWSVNAAATHLPWTSSRISRGDVANENERWTTKRTIAQRLVIDIPSDDLLSTPDFEADVRTALGRPRVFDKFKALNQVFEIWGDVLPVVFELGAMLAISDTSLKFEKLSPADLNFKLEDLSTCRAARVDVHGGDTEFTAGSVTSWLSKKTPPFQWSLTRIIRVVPTTDLLPSELKVEIQELYMSALSYRPPVLVGRTDQTTSFDGTPYTAKRIESVTVYAGSCVDSLTIKYSNGHSTTRHGGSGGRENVFCLSKDEIIIAVLIWEDRDETRGIQFMTNTGRVSPHYGGSGGGPNVLSVEDGALVAFSGKITNVVYRIQTIWRRDIAPTLPTRKHQYSAYLGGGGGTPFNDWPYEHPSDTVHVCGIKINSGSHVDNIQAIYSRTYKNVTSTFEGARHGGKGGHSHSFMLESDEYIVKVQGKYAGLMDQICFITNRGRSSGMYGKGGAGRQDFEIEAPTASNGERMRLCFIMGKSGSDLDGLLFVWGPAN